MLFDIHSHILPGVDDGSPNLEVSLAMLKEMKRLGVEKVIATPHFYGDKGSLSSYLRNINHAYNKLISACEGKGFPEILLGYEVMYFEKMSEREELKELCIENSPFILIEMPYGRITPKIADEIFNVKLALGLTPIMCHLERYFRWNSYDEVTSLFEIDGIRGHVNTQSLSKGFGRKKTLQLLIDGYCQYVASDAHNCEERRPMYKEAFDYIEKKAGKELVRQILSDSAELYDEIKNK